MVVIGSLALLGEVAIWLNAVLEAVQLPAGIADLRTSLANVDRDNFTHVEDGWMDGVVLFSKEDELKKRAPK